jgi:hypothetical protein
MINDSECDIDDMNDVIMLIDAILDNIIPNKHYPDNWIREMLIVRKEVLTDAKQKYANSKNIVVDADKDPSEYPFNIEQWGYVATRYQKIFQRNDAEAPCKLRRKR